MLVLPEEMTAELSIFVISPGEYITFTCNYHSVINSAVRLLNLLTYENLVCGAYQKMKKKT